MPSAKYFNIGDRVRVIHPNFFYDSYDEMVKLLGFKNPPKNLSPLLVYDREELCRVSFTVFGCRKHMHFIDLGYGSTEWSCVAIRDDKGNEFLYEGGGLELIDIRETLIKY